MGQTGSQKSNMAAAKPEILISQVLDKVDEKFQMLHQHFRAPASQWSCHQHYEVKPEVRNQIWRPPSLFVTSGLIRSVDDNSIEKLDPENVGVAFEILCLPYLESEI